MQGKYSRLIMRPLRCNGCGSLCANFYVLFYHRMFCELALERNELFPVRLTS